MANCAGGDDDAGDEVGLLAGAVVAQSADEDVMGAADVGDVAGAVVGEV